MNDNLLLIYLQELSENKPLIEYKNINKSFKELIKLEKQFSKTLRSFKEGRDVYSQFVYMINVKKGDIREARSYFRERLDEFGPTINKAISRHDNKTLYRLPINHKFCDFAIKSIIETDSNSGKIKEVRDVFNKIIQKRSEIISSNLYIALNRAKVFNYKNSSKLVELADMIQIANEELIVSVDKFVLNENSSEFHEMAIGRIIAALIISIGNASSALSIGTYAQKKLYSIKKEISKNNKINFSEMSKVLNIAESEIAALINATKHTSLSDPAFQSHENDEGSSLVIDRYYSNQDEKTVENTVIDNRMMILLKNVFNSLTVLEKKVLILKGVDINDNNE